jgi:hypothetical protein
MLAVQCAAAGEHRSGHIEHPTAERHLACQTLRREDPLIDCELRFRKTRKSEARLRCDRLPNRAI